MTGYLIESLPRRARAGRAGSDHTRPLFYFAMALGFNRNGALNRQFLASDCCAKLYRAPPSCSISNQPLEAYF